MGAIPMQRETDPRASGAPAHESGHRSAEVNTTLCGSPLAPGAARALLHAALAEWTELGLPGTEHVTQRLADDAVVVVSELVTNAVIHAGTDVGLVCRLEAPAGDLVVEVTDQHPSRAPRDSDSEPPYETPEYGRGLRLVATLAEDWGSPTAGAPRRCGRDCPPRRPARTPGIAASASPTTSPPNRSRPSGTGSGSTGAPCPSSPRPPTCSPDSSTRISSPRSPDS